MKNFRDYPFDKPRGLLPGDAHRHWDASNLTASRAYTPKAERITSKTKGRMRFGIGYSPADGNAHTAYRDAVIANTAYPCASHASSRLGNTNEAKSDNPIKRIATALCAWPLRLSTVQSTATNSGLCTSHRINMNNVA